MVELARAARPVLSLVIIFPSFWFLLWKELFWAGRAEEQKEVFLVKVKNKDKMKHNSMSSLCFILTLIYTRTSVFAGIWGGLVPLGSHTLTLLSCWL